MQWRQAEELLPRCWDERRRRRRRIHLLRQRDGRRAVVPRRGCASAAAALEWTDAVAVLALVGGDDHGGVVGGPLHALLHCAFAVGAPVVTPWERAVLDSFLAILPPSVAVVEVIELGLGHEREPRLPRPLQPLLRRRFPTPAYASSYIITDTNILLRRFD